MLDLHHIPSGNQYPYLPGKCWHLLQGGVINHLWLTQLGSTPCSLHRGDSWYVMTSLGHYVGCRWPGVKWVAGLQKKSWFAYGLRTMIFIWLTIFPGKPFKIILMSADGLALNGHYTISNHHADLPFTWVPNLSHGSFPDMPWPAYAIMMDGDGLVPMGNLTMI